MHRLLKNLPRITHFGFYILFFFTPLILFPKTSEIFEFNKVVFVYVCSTVILTLTFLYIITYKYSSKRNTLLIFYVLFLGSFAITTTFSSDVRTSLFGYYGRFNGGLFSLISYISLAFSFWIVMDHKSIYKLFYFILGSAFIVSIIAFLEHFGISLTCMLASDSILTTNFSCWEQDFATRAFSTIGQPNWLAAYLVSISPLSWTQAHQSLLIKDRKSSMLWILFSILLLTALLYTKSRSGFLGFIVALFTYLSVHLFTKIKISRKYFITLFVTFISLFAIISLFLYVSEFYNSFTSPNETIVITDSLTIRKLVWTSAIEIWNDNKLLGIGPETFAYFFPTYRSPLLNITSEWDFLFNKSHNEYLDYLVQTGLIGFSAYVLLIISSLHYLVKSVRVSNSNNTYSIALLSGYVGILVTNFLGFSVVITSLYFYLFPIIGVALSREKFEHVSRKSLGRLRIIALSCAIILGTTLLYKITIYWISDVRYQNALTLNKQNKIVESRALLSKLTKTVNKEPLYWNELSRVTSSLAALTMEDGKPDIAKYLAGSALSESQQALDLSPLNPQIIRTRVVVLSNLATVDLDYLYDARDLLLHSTTLYPNDPHTHYNAAVLLVRTGRQEEGIEKLLSTIILKPNYKEPRFALALLYLENNENEKALEQLLYIQQKIDPFDKRVNERINYLME